MHFLAVMLFIPDGQFLWTSTMIPDGATIWARKTLDSDIFRKADKWFKIWFYLVNRANHKAKGKFQRGQCWLSYEQITIVTGATKDQIKHCIKYMKDEGMLATQKATRGMFITIVNYDTYQNLNSYESHAESHSEATQKPHRSHTINKNVRMKECKKDKYSPEFETFWKAYVRGEEKSPAFGEWLKLLPEPPLIEHIMTAVAQQKIDGCLKDPRFAPYARRWIKNNRWTDTPIKAPTPEQKTCIRCDAPANYHINGEKEWFCSKDCRDKHQRENIR